MTADPILRIDPKTQLFRKDFAANAADLPGAGLSWLDARRGAALEAFTVNGMPTRRMEAWKFTDLAAVLDNDLEPATPFRAEDEAAIEGGLSLEGTTRIVLVNGYLHSIGGTPLDEAIDVVDLAQLSVRTPEWVEKTLGTLASGSDQSLGAASLALMRGGIAIRVREGAAGLPPLHVSIINPARGAGLMSHTRVLLLLERCASLDLIETHEGGLGAKGLANLGFEIVLAENARLVHTRIQDEAEGTVHVASIGASLGRHANYRALIANFGARLSRVDMKLKFAEEGAETSLRSVSVLGGETHADVTTVMDHAVPHTISKQLFKSVVGGRAKTVMQGRVSVRKGAVKTDSHQLYKALLLSPRAEADAKPELEIYADDVICGHGTAIGALDDNALFYLRARGIPPDEARALLVRAFLEDALEGFTEGAVRDILWQRIDAGLAKLSGGAA